jgi:hypothetical protein
MEVGQGPNSGCSAKEEDNTNSCFQCKSESYILMAFTKSRHDIVQNESRGYESCCYIGHLIDQSFFPASNLPVPSTIPRGLWYVVCSWLLFFHNHSEEVYRI